MEPDRTNYETWLIDYLDGKLDSKSESALLRFLDENPDIRDEFSDIISFSLPVTESAFTQKSLLKKKPEDLTDSQFEMICAAAAENDLGPEEEEEFRQLIGNDPEKLKISGIFRKLKLRPYNVEFRYKSRIKRLTIQQRIIRISLASISSAAAVILMVLLLRNPVPGLPAGNLLPGGTAQNEIIEDTQVRPPQPGAPENPIAAGTGKPAADERPVAYASAQSFTDEPPGDSIIISRFSVTDNISKIAHIDEVSLGKVRHETSLAYISMAEINAFDEEERSGLTAFMTRFFREKIVNAEEPESGSLKAYEIADAGINGINRLLGWELKLEKSRDESGEVNSVYFNSKLLKFTLPVKKSESAE